MKLNNVDQLVPIGKTAVLEQIPAEAVTGGGIILPDQAQKPKQFYWIRQIGEFSYSQDLIDKGMVYPDEVDITPDTFKVGDIVGINDNSCTVYQMDDKKLYALVRLRDINLKVINCD